MVVVESYVVDEGMRVRVRAVCTGQCHLGDRCAGEGIDTLVSTERIERLGFVLALIEGIEQVFQEYDRVLELLDH
jgi:hypothetical protein